MRRAATPLHFLLTLALAAALCASITSCTGPADDGQTIRIVRNIGGREGFRNHFETWKAAFESENPGWTLELVDLGDSDAAAYYKTRAATGDLPEILQTWSMTKYMVDGGMVDPIDESYYEEFGIAMPAPYKGKQYNSQGGLQFQGIAVNLDMWRSIGVTTPPQTWDELVDSLKKLQQAGHRPLVYSGRDWTASVMLSYLVHANLYGLDANPDEETWTQKRDAGEVSFRTDPAARLIVEKIIELVDLFPEKGALSDGYAEAQRLFYGGEGATWFMGCWIAGDLEPNKVEVDIDYWPIPSLTDRPPVYISNFTMQSGWAISSGLTAEKKAMALKVLECFYEPEIYQLFLNAEGMFSTASKVDVQGPKSDYEPAQRLYDRMARGLETFKTTPGWWRDLEDQAPPTMNWQRPMQEILAGERDVDKILAIMDDEWDRARKGQ